MHNNEHGKLVRKGHPVGPRNGARPGSDAQQLQPGRAEMNVTGPESTHQSLVTLPFLQHVIATKIPEVSSTVEVQGC